MERVTYQEWMGRSIKLQIVTITDGVCIACEREAELSSVLYNDPAGRDRHMPLELWICEDCHKIRRYERIARAVSASADTPESERLARIGAVVTELADLLGIRK